MTDLMNSIALQSMSMHTAQYQQSYDVAITKKAMNAQEAEAQKLLEMLPQTSPKGVLLDVYA